MGRGARVRVSGRHRDENALKQTVVSVAQLCELKPRICTLTWVNDVVYELDLKKLFKENTFAVAGDLSSLCATASLTAGRWEGDLKAE